MSKWNLEDDRDDRERTMFIVMLIIAMGSILLSAIYT
mgnify:CR=1 FL=1|jgi:hypothetical protein